jgi:hypothetical protein
MPAPERPENFADYPAAILAYLNASPANRAALQGMLIEWGTMGENSDQLPEGGKLVLTERKWGVGEIRGQLLEKDVDDDGQAELLLAIWNPIPEGVAFVSGEVLIIDQVGEEYHIAYQATAGELLYGALTFPLIVGVEDVNADDRTEVIFASFRCGAHTCGNTVYIIAWDGTDYRHLTAGFIDMSYSEIAFDDRDSDGIKELVMYGGTIGSVGAGPQRARTEIYRWDGSLYTLAETIYDPPEYLYHAVLDANAALLAGDYEEAIALYRRAIDDQTLEDWKGIISEDAGEKERLDLAAFSRFRLVVAYALLGDYVRARAALEEIESEQPDHVYAEVARIFWEVYEPAGDVGDACQAVTQYAQEHPETVEVMANYGYGNPSFTAEEVCPTALSMDKESL